MEEGEIEVDSIEPIGFPDITPELARESGFLGVLDLLKEAKHGSGQKIYLIRFHYIPRSLGKKFPVSVKKYPVFNGLPHGRGCKYFHSLDLAAEIRQQRT